MVWEIVIFNEFDLVVDRKIIEMDKPVSMFRAFGEYEKIYGRINGNYSYSGNMIF